MVYPEDEIFPSDDLFPMNTEAVAETSHGVAMYREYRNFVLADDDNVMVTLANFIGAILNA